MVGLHKLSRTPRRLQTPLEWLLSLFVLFAIAGVAGWGIVVVCLLLPGAVLLFASVVAVVLAVLLLLPSD
jgi:hypothetical protein